MQIISIRSLSDADLTATLVIPIYSAEGGGVISCSVDAAILADFAFQNALEDHRGKEGKCSLCYTRAAGGTRIVLWGIGDSGKIHIEKLRRLCGNLVKFCQGEHIAALNLPLPAVLNVEPLLTVRALAEGLWLSNYRFERYRSVKAVRPLDKVGLISAEPGASGVIEKASNLIKGVNLARDLVNGNADDVTPQFLAKTAQQLQIDFPAHLQVRVCDRQWLQEQKMDLILAVSKGSACEPLLIIVEYRAQPASDTCCLIVGKGVTYDTGGLNLKPTGSMETMKGDMAGAAAVLGALATLAERQLPINVVAVIPAVENSIDANSYKPGDVYTSYLGKTVEIANTDAEGRLILADALAYGCEQFNPSCTVDLATLTGAAIIALGDEAAALMSNSEALQLSLSTAARTCGEKICPLPLYEEYSELLKSDIADLKNVGGRPAGTILGGLFLQEFVGQTPWAHLDIAGPAYLTKAKHYHPCLGTGMGVRLLLEFFEGLANKDPLFNA